MLARDRTPSDARPFRHAKLIIRPALVTMAIDPAVWQKGRAVANARAELALAEAKYAEGCKWLGEANRRMSPKHSGAGVWPLSLRQAWRRDAFRQINKARAAMRAARKAFTALEAA